MGHFGTFSDRTLRLCFDYRKLNEVTIHGQVHMNPSLSLGPKGAATIDEPVARLIKQGL